jgi:hypothetical protein
MGDFNISPWEAVVIHLHLTQPSWSYLQLCLPGDSFMHPNPTGQKNR